MTFAAAGTAPGCIDNDVADAEPAFDRSGFHRHVLNVFERDGGLMDRPDPASDAQTSLAEDVPGGVVTKMDREISQKLRHGPQQNRDGCGQHANPWPLRRCRSA